MNIVSTSTRGGHPGKKKHGTKRTGHTSTNHHHHENKSDKVNTQDMQVAIRNKERGIVVEDRPMPVIDIGEKQINELIHSITGENEDASQDVWVSILEGNCLTEKDIILRAREAKNKSFAHLYAEKSLQKPIADNDGNPLTIEDVIASPELVFDEPEPSEVKTHSKSYTYKQGMDNDVLALLRNKYPGESLRYALRMALGLPTKPTKIWKSAEISLLQMKYPTSSAEAMANELGRTVDAVRNKACELKVEHAHQKVTPKGSYNFEDVMGIFHFSAKHLRHLLALGYLHWRRWKNIKIFRQDDIIDFIRNHPFYYRHDLIESAWKTYVPKEVWKWVTIEEVAESTHWSHFKIRRMVKDCEIPVRYYGNGNKSVAYLTLEIANTFLEIEGISQPYCIAWKGDKKHYVYWNEEDDLVTVCNPQQRGVPRTAMTKFGYKPFTKGIPTCLKCLRILENYGTTKCK